MKKWLKSVGISAAALVLAAGCSTEQPGSENDGEDTGTDEGSEEAAEGDVTIGLSVSTLNNPFFVTLADGAEAAAEEEGVNIEVADAQDGSASQVSDIEDFIQQGVDVLLINPVDSSAVASAIETANSEDIPVITVDRSAEGGEVVSHIASDNVAGGEMAAEHIVEELGGSGNVIELTGIPGSSAANERGEGFHNIVDEEDGIEVVANQTANFNRSEGLTVTENILQSTDEVDALFAHNDEMALGAVEALEAAGMEDVMVVGFDAIDDAVGAVEEGTMAATIAQQPQVIGEEAVNAAISVDSGEEIEDSIPVELELITE
ncbi:D-ribose ABC transporter substrate-binding protein [Salibacterium aidingense]|uniref:D-ribose ABC transporter substrate-binding protein n=1 Tax=Salibacterium aidingense TaxID=384933 RepID=UPI000418E306|nr:D-ribose ABC transporter substrate-binding protein [Salibacterium aidingense]